MIRSKAALYALLAVYEIGKQHRGRASPLGVRASDIALKYELPKAYTAKVMSQLAHGGVLQSDRGPHGGFHLSRTASDISLCDVFTSVGGIGAEERASRAKSELPRSLEAMFNRVVEDAAQKVRTVLQRTSVADLLDDSTDE